MGLHKCFYAMIVLLIFYAYRCSSTRSFKDVDKKYYLVLEAYNVATNLFNLGRNKYNLLKAESVEAINIFLDLVQVMNIEMGRELRSAIVKFYKLKYFHDFTNYIMSMEEVIDITEHCLMESLEKQDQIRTLFLGVINNFEDVRNFNTVDKCNDQLPDEVAVTHCILHQAVLFNETMQESLVAIVTIKTRQHAQDMNTSIYNVHHCLNDFVPNFFDQVLVVAYTKNCGYMKVLNACITDLMNEQWVTNETIFTKKWGPVTRLLQEKLKLPNYQLQNPLYQTLLPMINVTLKENAKSSEQ